MQNKAINSLINIIPLINYVLTTTSQAVTHIRESWWFESMYTLQGKTWYTRHVHFPRQSMYATRTLPTGSPRTWQPLTLTQQSWTDTTAPKKKCSWLHLSARLSGPRDLLQFLSQHNHWSSRVKPSIYWRTCYIDLLGPYLQHVIGTFNTCSRGLTHQSLTDTGGSYNLGGAGFPHHSLRPSQPTLLRFPPKGSTQSQVNHPTIANWTKEETNPKSHEWDSSTRLLP
jgi:hypothetical protein